jgi:hypothetical protein
VTARFFSGCNQHREKAGRERHNSLLLSSAIAPTTVRKSMPGKAFRFDELHVSKSTWERIRCAVKESWIESALRPSISNGIEISSMYRLLSLLTG